MHIITKLAVAIIVMALSGCAATVSKSGAGENAPKTLAQTTAAKKLIVTIAGGSKAESSPDWQLFRAEWRTAFTNAASTAGVAFAFVEGDVPEQSAGTVHVKLSVKDYRYLSPGARYAFGVMTGNAYIESSAEFIELPAKQSIGTKQYSTSSSAWQGIFSAMTEKQVAAISAEIISDLKR